jgi:hypothetical protein
MCCKWPIVASSFLFLIFKVSPYWWLEIRYFAYSRKSSHGWVGGISCHVRGGSLSSLLFCCTIGLLLPAEELLWWTIMPSHSHDVLTLSSFLLHSYCVYSCFYLFWGKYTKATHPFWHPEVQRRIQTRKSEISVRQEKGAFSLPTAPLPAVFFVDLWRAAAAHVAGAVGTAEHNKFRGARGAYPANEMLGNIRYIRWAIAMHHHRAPNPPSIHRFFRQSRFFSPPQICDVGGLANAPRGLSKMPNLARVEVSGGSSKI